jgi:hypothetical protein
MIARYEIRVGKRTRGRKKSKLCDFGDNYTDIVIVDKKDNKTLGWNIQEVKDKMGLEEDDYKVLPYLLNLLLIRMQESDWSKAKKK